MTFKKLFILIFMLLLIIGCKNKPKKIQVLKPLKGKSEFRDSTYFSFAWMIQPYKNTLFIDDYKNNRVLKLDTSLTLLKSFGRFGRGPGEFQGTGTMLVNHDSVYVYDDAGVRFNVYDVEGHYLRTFNISHPLRYARIALINQRIYMSSSTNIKNSSIFVTDLEGNLLYHFEKSPIDDPRIHSKNRLLFSNADQNQIIALPIAEPFVERYNKEGKFIGSYDLRKLKRLHGLWESYEKKANENKGTHTTQILFSDAYMQGNIFYILCNPWKGRDNYSYIIKLKIGNKSIKPISILKIQGTEPQMRFFNKMAVKGHYLIATEGMSQAVFKFDLSELK